jgi:hypothetical protein
VAEILDKDFEQATVKLKKVGGNIDNLPIAVAAFPLSVIKHEL